MTALPDGWERCTCMQYGPHEHLVRWQARALPIVTALAARGYPVSSDEMDKVVALILVMETGAPACFDPANAHRSHHLPDCPYSIRNRVGTRSSPADQAAARERSAAQRVAAHAAVFRAFAVNSLFAGEGGGTNGNAP